ncbi:MAG: molecular chaperone TorD family protein [Sedimenticola sp.]
MAINSSSDLPPLVQFCHFTAEDLTMLATLHSSEPDQTLITALHETGFPENLGILMTSTQGLWALDFMERALTTIPEPVDKSSLDELAVDYAGIYLNYSFKVSPEESVWLDEENLTHQDAMFQVREVYQQHGLTAADWRKVPDDHLVLELQFIAYLLENGQDEGALRESGGFLDKHLLRWLPLFATRIAARCDTPYYAGLASLTAAYCEELRDTIVKILGEPRPDPKEIEERMKPKIEAQPQPVPFVPGVGPTV